MNINVSDIIYILEPAITYDQSSYTYDDLISYDGFTIPVEEVSFISNIDNITITELYSVLNNIPNISIFDSININENIIILNSQLGNINVSDLINIIDNFVNSSNLYLNTSDFINIVENLIIHQALGDINISDLIDLIENNKNELQSNPNVSDNINTSEFILTESFLFSPSSERPIGKNEIRESSITKSSGSVTPVGQSR